MGVPQSSKQPRPNVEWKILAQTFSFKSDSSLTPANEAQARGSQNQRVGGHSALVRPGGPLASCTHPTDPRAEEEGASGHQGSSGHTWQVMAGGSPLPAAPASGPIYVGPPQAGLVLGQASWPDWA